MSTTALLFSFAIGIGSVALPLLALREGYGASQVGILVSLSAVAQIVTRARLAAVMRRVPDRILVAAAAVAQVASVLVVLASTGPAVLATAWFLQGFARACFWTGGQTHVVRGQGTSMQGLALLNFVASVGQLGGPVVAGLLAERDIDAALLASGVVAAIGVAPVWAMDRLAPFTRSAEARSGALLRTPRGPAACWAGVAAGAWRGLMDSFVPVALQAAGQPASTIGMLVAVANGAAVLGTVVVAKARTSATAGVYLVCMLASGLGMAVVGYTGERAAVAAVMLAVAGLGAGALQTLGPALASGAVSAQEQGEAIATYGTARAHAMFGTPLGLAALVLTMPVAPALLLAGLALSVPTLAVRSLRR
jgi:MFS family permease